MKKGHRRPMPLEFFSKNILYSAHIEHVEDLLSCNWTTKKVLCYYRIVKKSELIHTFKKTV
jgi:hypothetical protein